MWTRGEERVRTTHLLRDHDGERRQVSPSDSRNSKQLGEPFEVVGLSDEFLFDFELGVDVKDVAGDLDGIVPQQKHGFPGLRVAVLFHVPTGRFRAEVDENQERYRGEEGCAQHQAPVDGAGVPDCEVECGS